MNLVMDVKLDSVNRRTNNDKARNALKTMLDDFMIIDPWRDKNPDKFEFTWHRKRPNEVFARLDYIFVNHALMSELISVTNVPSYRSDHCAVKMTIKLNESNPRGPGFWKLNETLLTKIENVQRLNKMIDDRKQTSVGYDPCTRWELMKETVVNECKQISIENAHNRSKVIHDLQKNLQKANERLLNCNEVEKDSIYEEINDNEIRLNEYLKYKADRARIRSRSLWYSKGEKSSKYFLGLEKVKSANKTLTVIRCADNSIKIAL